MTQQLYPEGLYSESAIEEKLYEELKQAGKLEAKITPLTPTEYSITNQLQIMLEQTKEREVEIKELLALLDKYQDVVKLFGLLRKYSLF